MATKTGLLATINGFLTAVITQTKHRSSMSSIVDEIYPSSISDANTTETYTTKSGTNFNYNVTIIKSGNIANIKGTIQNASGSLLPPQNIFAWKENEYKAISGLGTSINFESEGIRYSISSSGLALLTAMPNGTYNFEFQTYITQP
jgi:hypothetical protein